MIVDVRTYTIVPRKVAQYVEIFEKHALPVQRRHVGEPLGYFISMHGTLNQVVHLWGFESLADLEARRAKRDADPDWQAYLAMTEGLVMAQENQLTRPASFSAIG